MRRGRPGRDDGGVTALGVLGPLLLAGDAGPVRIGSARQRRLLAALDGAPGAARRRGQARRPGVGGRRAGRPGRGVQTNVARLRRLLPGGIRLATTPEGYRLEADRDVVDVTAFADHLAAATATADPSARRDRLGAALALWRGCPYPELDHPALAAEVARLSELHAGAAEQHAEALLAAGRVAEAVAELEALLATEPLREGAVAVLMRALVAAGRQGDALAGLRPPAHRLAEELGLDPSPQLRDLERRVLCQDLPVPAARRPPPPAPAAPPRRPRIPISSFIGARGALSPTRTTCWGGTGSSRSAVPAAWARPGWPCTSRRSRRAATTTASCWSSSARAAPTTSRRCSRPHCGWRTRARRRRPGGFADRVVALLAVRRQLLVFDNCEHVLDAAAGLVEAICAGTGRGGPATHQPRAAHGWTVSASRGRTAESGRRRHASPDRMRAAEPPPDGPGRVAARARRRGLPPARRPPAGVGAGRRPRRLARALRSPPRARRAVSGPARRPRTATARHRSLRDVVEWSYGLLDAEQRALFERLSVFAGPVEYAAVEAVCGDAAALPDLVDRSLVVRRAGDPQTFGMLETLRAFGRSRLAVDPSAQRLRARHATWAAGLAEEVSAGRRGPGELAASRRFDLHLADLRRAHAWLCVHGPLDELLRLTVPIAELSVLRGRADLVVLLEETLRVAGVLGPEPVHPPALPLVARLLGYHAHTLWQRGDLDTGERQARRALEIAAAVE